MSATKLIIDRIEGDFVVVLLNNKSYNIPKILLPSNVQEGGCITINYAEPDAADLAEAQARINRLKKRDSGKKSIDL